MNIQVVSRRRKLSVARLPNGALLAVGGRPPVGKLIPDLGFSVLVLMADSYQPGSRGARHFPGVTVVHAPIPDDKPTSSQVRTINEVGDYVAASLRARKNVAVTCEMGLNRSAIVAAAALVKLGASPSEAVRTLRSMRGGFALNNRHFVRLLG